MTFGEKLQKLRARAGLSQDQLAELLDVSRQAVSKWERNEAMPEAEKLVRISRQFRVSTDYLLLEELEEPETASVPALRRACGDGSSSGTGTGAICWPGSWRPGAVCGWGYWIPHGQVLPDMPVPGLELDEIHAGSLYSGDHVRGSVGFSGICPGTLGPAAGRGGSVAITWAGFYCWLASWVLEGW